MDVPQPAVTVVEPEQDVEIDPVEAVVCTGCGAEIDTTEVAAFSRIACPACGTELEVSAKFGNFRLLKVLGSGGMGSVFLGQDDALNRKVAIKVVKRSIGGNPGMLEGFQREAQATARLNHPNIVQIYAFGQEKGQPYIAMELVGGGSLDAFIEKKKRLDPAFVLRVGKEIALALGAAQEAGLIHGDVKPENILFDENYRAKLVDFGIASALSADVNAKEIWGTPYYIAPEKAKGKKADIRSDLYSLGATLYHALTLHPPFDGADARAVVAARYTQSPAPIGKYRPDADRKAIEIIDRMLQSNPMLRFPTIGSLVASIDEFLKTVPAARADRPVSEASAVRLVPVKGGPSLVTKKVTAAAAPVPSESAPEASRKGGKKIIIAKGKGKTHVSVPSQGHMPPVEASIPQPEGAAEGAPVGMEEQLPPGGIPEMVVETEPSPEERKKKALKAIIITVGIVFVLAIAGVIGVFMMLVGGEKDASRESAARVAEAKQIEQDAEQYDNRVKAAADRIKKMDEEARKLVKEIEKVACEASETPWKAPSLDPTDEILIDPPQEAAPEATASAGDAAGAGAAPAAPAAAGLESLLALKDDPAFSEGKNAATRKMVIKFAKENPELAKDAEFIAAVVALVRDPENIKDADMMEIAVEGAFTKALEKAKAAAEAAAAAAPAEASAGLAEAMDAMPGAADAEAADAEASEAAEAESGDAVVAAEPAVEDHAIVVKAMELLEPARRIRRCLKEAELRVDRETDMFSPLKGNSITTQQYNERIRFKKTRENDEKVLLAMIDACQADLSALRKGKSLLEKEAKKFLQQIQVRKAAEEKQRLEDEEKERQARNEAERKSRIQRDLDEVEVLKSNAQEAIEAFDYERAVKQLSAYRGQYAAKEANEALQAAIDRTQRLADLRQFILSDLHQNKGLSWGLGTRDITDADPKTGLVTARGGASADISKLTLKQWMGLIERLIVKREPNRTPLTLKQEGDMLYASALFCVVHGGGMESALKRAEELARAATLKSEVVRRDIPRISPELSGALESEL